MFQPQNASARARFAQTFLVQTFLVMGTFALVACNDTSPDAAPPTIHQDLFADPLGASVGTTARAPSTAPHAAEAPDAPHETRPPLGAYVALRGRVLDARTQRPEVNCLVSYGGQEIFTDERGQFELHEVREHEDVRIRFRCRGLVERQIIRVPKAQGNVATLPTGILIGRSIQGSQGRVAPTQSANETFASAVRDLALNAPPRTPSAEPAPAASAPTAIQTTPTTAAPTSAAPTAPTTAAPTSAAPTAPTTAAPTTAASRAPASTAAAPTAPVTAQAPAPVTAQTTAQAPAPTPAATTATTATPTSATAVTTPAPAPPRRSTRPRVTAEVTQNIEGPLSPADLRPELRRRAEAFYKCYATFLETEARGETHAARFRFTILADGTVESVRILGSTFLDDEQDVCVARRLRRLTFPAAASSSVVTQTFIFSTQFDAADRIP